MEPFWVFKIITSREGVTLNDQKFYFKLWLHYYSLESEIIFKAVDKFRAGKYIL